jgi:hypothetical protein
MPEEAIETQELKEKLEDARETAERGAPWLFSLSLSTALIAVFAAIGALQSGAHANEAIVEKNEAVLSQAQAADEWSYFQAKGIKAAIYATQAEALATSNAQAAAKLRAEAQRETSEQQEMIKRAKEHETQVAEHNGESRHSLHIHEQFAKSVTIFQVAIALAAIAAMTRRRFMWFVSLGVGATALLFFAKGFGLLGG